MSNEVTQYIRLGYPLDQLMNRECPFPGLGVESGQQQVLGGITLPKRGHGVSSLNTGNIVIRGRPGTGKSTLALQIAVACAQSGYLAAYYSLELPAEKVLQKADKLGWDEWLRPVEHLHRIGDPPSREELGRMIMQILTQPKDCPLRPGSARLQTKCCGTRGHQVLGEEDIRKRILLPSVSPRRLDDDDSSDSLFWARLRQIENMLEGAEWLEESSTAGWLGANYPGWVKQEERWLKTQARCLEKRIRRIPTHENLEKDGKSSAQAAQAARKLCHDDPHNQNAFADAEGLSWKFEKRCEELAWFKERRDNLDGLIKGFLSLTTPVAPRLRVVCIDSLNVFGEKPLTREHLFRVFDLFSRNNVIGVFVVEEDVAGSSDFSTAMGDDTIDYLADTVISLEHKQDKDYSVRHLEIVKSRYQQSVDGKHPFKLRSADVSQRRPRRSYEPNDRTGQALLVYPSLHHVVRASDRQERGPESTHFDLGDRKLKQVLPKNLLRPSVVAIAGPRGTFKTKLGIDFLMKGLTKEESGLLIRLHDRTSGDIPSRVSLDLKYIPWKKWLVQDPDTSTATGKVMRKSHRYRDGRAVLLERAFKSGYLLPEEFIDEIAVTMNMQREIGKPIQRVVLDDVCVIGLSYPFLYSNHTAGDLFLPAFVHLMRIYGVDLVITGTTGDLDRANEYVKRATAIADAVVSCEFCDVFGERYVTITGEGLAVEASGVPGAQGEMAPGVFRLNDVEKEWYCRTFEIDLEHLRGLVGFDTKHIHRPGLSLHCFEEVGNIHHRYNNDIAKLLQFAFASPPDQTIGAGPPDVSVVRFNSRTSVAVADSLGVLGDAPINRTVVCTLDEFWSQDDTKMAELTRDAEDPFLPDGYIVRVGHSAYVRPYYGNVLLLAYRCDEEFDRQVRDRIEKAFERYDNQDPPRPIGPASWGDVAEIADLINKEAAKNAHLAGANYPGTERPFEVDLSAPETVGCAVLGALLAGGYDPNASAKDFDVDDKKWKKLVEAWTAIAGLLISVPKHKADDPRKLDDPDQISKYRVLGADSAVYLCWYSQLRELVYSHPELAHRLKVCPIPGGGFKGDWYIGVTKGSLSASLGSKVVKILTDPTEDYKRFGRGVGLPAHKGFENAEFSAWPNSQENLKHVMGIHQAAKRRSEITERYSDIRRALYNAGQELLVSDHFKEVLEKLMTQLSQLPLKPTARGTGNL